MMTSANYIGRFAPSPTGPLHMGSLLCALISYLDAKSNQGQWLLRIDDLDQSRIDARFSKAIINTLEAHGFCWDQDIVYQSSQSSCYQQAFEILKQQQIAFACSHSRQSLKQQYAGRHLGAHIAKPSNNPEENAWRVKLGSHAMMTFDDQLLGKQCFDLSEQGAFVIKRKEGFFSYHLACVVDDYLSGVTHIVRGQDLLESSAAQIFLQQKLGYPIPKYAHHFLIGNQQGQKLSKQNMAKPVDNTQACNNLLFCLKLLDLHFEHSVTSISELLKWAVSQWSLNSIKSKKQVILNHHDE